MLLIRQRQAMQNYREKFFKYSIVLHKSALYLT